jgi:AbiV family abortive infection protein
MGVYFPLIDYNKGIMLSKENAKRLIDDAKMLFEAKKYPSAFYLAIQGIEEIGKALLFLKYKREQKKITESQWEKVFMNHEKKLGEVYRAISKHCVKIRVFEGWGGNFKKYFPEDEVQKMLVGALKLDKEKFAYVEYDFRKQKWFTPLKPDLVDLEGVVKSIVYGYSRMGFYALEKEMM